MPQNDGSTPWVGDENQFKGQVANPSTKFTEITRDITMGMHKEEDVEIFTMTMNIIKFIDNMIISKEARAKLGTQDPFPELKESFEADMNMFSNALRGVKGKTAELLLTKKVHKRFSGDEMSKRLMSKEKEEDDYQ